MLPTFQIGPLALPVPAFSIMISIWLGISLAEKQARKHAMTADMLTNLVFIGIITGIICARLGFALQSISAFFQSPLSIFSINPSMLDPFSGLAAALLAIFIYGKRAKISYKHILDALTPILAVTAIGLAFAHIASGESFGSVTNLPWSIELWGAKRHPTQFYELFSATTIFCLLMLTSINRLEKPGALFLIFCLFSSSAILFLESFHGDSATIMGGFRTNQIIAWTIQAIGLPILHKIMQEKPER